MTKSSRAGLAGAACGLAAVAVLGLARASGPAEAARPILRARFSPVARAPIGTRMAPGQPSFYGKALRRGPGGAWQAAGTLARMISSEGVPVTTTAGDVFLADGSETAIAVNPYNGRNLATIYNQGYLNTSSMKTSADGNVTWATRTFPNGTGTFSGYAYDPWAVPGNGSGVLLTGLIRTDSVPGSSEARVIIARSTGGVADGQVYLMANAPSSDGTTAYVLIHEVTGGGSSLLPDKAIWNYVPAGQRLGSTSRFGLNGHRTGGPSMDIDRSTGRRRGTLYIIVDENPNPADPTLDQGDVVLALSSDGGVTWSSATLPGLAAGKTQFFSMIDVDANGWIHVAYYQNETGGTNGGVLNAGSADVYYTGSSDGGQTQG